MLLHNINNSGVQQGRVGQIAKVFITSNKLSRYRAIPPTPPYKLPWHGQVEMNSCSQLTEEFIELVERNKNTCGENFKILQKRRLDEVTEK